MAIAATPTGVLITATDRNGFIDDGLLSRIDIAVEFKLRKDIRRRIWTDNIVAFTNRKTLPKADADRIHEIAKLTTTRRPCHHKYSPVCF